MPAIIASMETEISNKGNVPPKAQGYQLDAAAIEALSAGIGLGSLVNKKKRRRIRSQRTAAKTISTKRQATATRVVPKVRFSFVRSVLAWCCDLLIIAASLLAATCVAHYATTNTLPAPADVVFTLGEHFAAHEVAIASAVMMSAYFLLFKLLTGFTLGEALLGIKRK